MTFNTTGYGQGFFRNLNEDVCETANTEPKQIQNEKQAIRIRVFNLALLPSSYTAREAKRFRNANNHPHRLAISVLRNALGSTNGFCTAAMSSAVVRAGRIARRAADRLNRSPAHGRIGASAAAGRDAAGEYRPRLAARAAVAHSGLVTALCTPGEE